MKRNLVDLVVFLLWFAGVYIIVGTMAIALRSIGATEQGSLWEVIIPMAIVFATLCAWGYLMHRTGQSGAE